MSAKSLKISLFVLLDRNSSIFNSYTFLEFEALYERNNDIAPFREHSTYSNFKVGKKFDVLFVCFNVSLLMQFACAKVLYSGNSRCSTKEAAILLRSWCTLYIAFSKCTVTWFWFVKFNMSLLFQIR